MLILLISLFSHAQWKPEYSTFVQSKVEVQMLSLSSFVMGSICPNWNAMNSNDRKVFYSDLLFAVSKLESNQEPRSLYYEDLGIDQLTKQHVVSEGILQLSYQDALWYKCDFDYKKDKQFHIDDLAHRNGKISWLSHHSEKDTINSYKNIDCSLKIISKLLQKHPKEEFAHNLSRYWSTMRSKKLPQIKALMKSRKSNCFQSLE